MIISHTNQFIFLKTRKTAGTSFEIALSKYAGTSDIVTPLIAADEETRASLGYPGPRNYQLPTLGPDGNPEEFFNHIPARKVKALIGRQVFRTYLKVSIVRNPFDMAVSAYFWALRETPREASIQHFRQWVLSGKAVNRNRAVTHIRDRCVVDHMIRYEFLQQDVDQFAKFVGLPPTLFAELNAIRAKGHFRPRAMTTQQMFDGFPEGREVIATLFAEDIATYNYTCP